MAPDHDADVPVEFQDSTQQPNDPDQAGGPAVAGEPDSPRAEWAQGAEESAGDEQAGLADAQSPEGNLLQLPDGAAFGQEGEPSAAERERLLRHAGGVQREMRAESLAEDDD